MFGSLCNLNFTKFLVAASLRGFTSLSTEEEEGGATTITIFSGELHTLRLQVGRGAFEALLALFAGLFANEPSCGTPWQSKPVGRTLSAKMKALNGVKMGQPESSDSSSPQGLQQ